MSVPDKKLLSVTHTHAQHSCRRVRANDSDSLTTNPDQGRGGELNRREERCVCVSVREMLRGEGEGCLSIGRKVGGGERQGWGAWCDLQEAEKLRDYRSVAVSPTPSSALLAGSMAGRAAR